MMVHHFRKSAIVGALTCIMMVSAPLTGASARTIDNPYPTAVIADYVFGCMNSNGQTREALTNCSCSIDVISTIISYEAYQRAETVLSLRLLGGEKSAVFKTSARWKEAVGDLRRAQAEAEVRCF